jgi:hypothetical protein
LRGATPDATPSTRHHRPRHLRPTFRSARRPPRRRRQAAQTQSQ